MIATKLWLVAMAALATVASSSGKIGGGRDLECYTGGCDIVAYEEIVFYKPVYKRGNTCSPKKCSCTTPSNAPSNCGTYFWDATKASFDMGPLYDGLPWSTAYKCATTSCVTARAGTSREYGRGYWYNNMRDDIPDFPDSTARWLWHTAGAGYWDFNIPSTKNNTAGYNASLGNAYCYAYYTPAVDTNVSISWTVDNDGGLYIDGDMIMEPDYQYNSVKKYGNLSRSWMTYYQTPFFTLGAGRHLIMLRVRNWADSTLYTPFTPAGFILTAKNDKGAVVLNSNTKTFNCSTTYQYIGACPPSPPPPSPPPACDAFQPQKPVATCGPYKFALTDLNTYLYPSKCSTTIFGYYYNYRDRSTIFPDDTAEWIWTDQYACYWDYNEEDIGILPKNAKHSTLYYASLNNQFFYAVFNVSKAKYAWVEAKMAFTADNEAELFIDGTSTGVVSWPDNGYSTGSYKTVYYYNYTFFPGKHLITMRARNWGGPAAFIFTLRDASGTVLLNTNNVSWTVATDFFPYAPCNTQTTTLPKCPPTVKPGNFTNPLQVCGTGPGTVSQPGEAYFQPGGINISHGPGGEISIECPYDYRISAITFGHYGTPGGTCGAYTRTGPQTGQRDDLPTCLGVDIADHVWHKCHDKNFCAILSRNDVHADPCEQIYKRMAIEATCAWNQLVTGSHDTCAVGLGTYYIGGENEFVHIRCPAGTVVTKINFASYGDSYGSCKTTYTIGNCHAPNSTNTVSALCMGKELCQILIKSSTFGFDPCPGIWKNFHARATCSVNPLCISPSGVTLRAAKKATTPAQSPPYRSPPTGALKKWPKVKPKGWKT